jgi:hypothetical protein
MAVWGGGSDMPARPGQAGRRTPKGAGKRWVRTVTTVSTAPPEDLFTRDARTIA